MAHLNLSLFGGFQARIGGQRLALPTRKAEALLAYLAVRPGRAHLRDKLAGVFWSSAGRDQARHSLRQALSSLRGALSSIRGEILLVEGERVALGPSVADVDVLEFERLAAQDTLEALEQAVTVYGGDLLEGVHISEEPFENWLLAERARLREAVVTMLPRLVTHHVKSNAFESAIQTAARLLALDPLREETHRTLMRLYARQGRLGDALRQYQTCVAVLQRELGVEPAEETRRAYREIVPKRQFTRRPSDGQSRPAPRRGVPGPATSPRLIGRQVELAELREALREALRGSGQTVAIVGEAGIGKTRVVEELAREAERRSCRVLTVRAHETERALPFAPWADLLRAGLRLHEEATVARSTPVWQGELARLLPELGDPGGPPAARNTLRVFDAVSHFLRDLVSERPLVLIFEDLHWADETSVGLLTFLARRIEAWPLLIIGTARKGDLGEASLLRRLLEEPDGRLRVRQLVLSPLSRAETATLVRALASRDIDPPAAVRLADEVWELSEGNPFMVVETMRALGAGEIPAEHSRLPLPQRVREVIAGRLKRLSRRAQDLVAVAATIGREFDFVLLQRAAGLGGLQTAEGVEELVRTGVIQGVDERFDFTHDRIREVIYDRLPSHRRRELHRRVAEAMERLNRDALEPSYAALARHFREAEMWRKALLYLSRAGMQAVGRSANREAVAIFERAIETFQHLPRGHRTLEQATDLRIALEHALLLVGEPERALEYLLEAEMLAVAIDDEWRLGWVCNYLSEYHRTVSEHEQALEVGRRALAIGDKLGDGTLQAETRLRLGQVCHARGDYREAVHLLRLNVMAPAGTPTPYPGDGSLLATLSRHRARAGLMSILSRTWLVWCLAELGQFSEGLEHLQDVIKLAESSGTGDPFQLMLAHLAAGRLHLRRGDRDQAVSMLERCEEHRKLGNLEIWSPAIGSTLGYAYLQSGRLTDAMTRLTAAVEQANAMKSMFGHSLRLAYLGEAVLLVGQSKEAADHARCALEAARAQKERGHEAYALRLIAELTARQEPLDVKAGVTAYREALELAEELGMRPLAAQCHLGLGRLGRRAGEPALMQEHLTTADALYGEMGMSGWSQMERRGEMAVGRARGCD
jgi:DNA-binding SARP family transcriptional activator